MIKATYLLKKRLRFKGVHVTLTRRLLYINLNGNWFSGVTKLHQAQVIKEQFILFQLLCFVPSRKQYITYYMITLHRYLFNTNYCSTIMSFYLTKKWRRKGKGKQNILTNLVKKQKPKREPRFETEPTRFFNDNVLIRIQVLAVTYFHVMLFSLIQISHFKSRK